MDKLKTDQKQKVKTDMKIKCKILTGILTGLMLCGNVYGQSEMKPQIESQAAVVMDIDSGKILYSKNETQKFYPASIVKLLTALVTAERANLDDTVIFSYDAVYGVEQGSGNPLLLEAGDKLSVKDCMYAMILESSNQAANALAEYVAGSNEKFAVYMNEEAQKLGCKDSNFVNPSGLNDEKQQVTAEDMALISRAAFQNDTVREIASSKTYRISSTLNNARGITLEMEHQLLNGNEYSYEYAFAGKTGYTAAAGNTMVTAARKDGHEILSVVLKSDMTHYEDTIKLLDYGFESINSQPALQEETTEKESSPQITDTDSGITDEKQDSVSGIAGNIFRSIIIAVFLSVAAYLTLVCIQRYRRKLRRIRKQKKIRKK